MLDPLRCDYRDNRLLAALPFEFLAAIERDLRFISLSQGAVIYSPGDLLDTIYFPLSGLISLGSISKAGATIEVGIIGREGAFGLRGRLGRCYSSTGAAMQIGGTCAIIGAARFAQSADDNVAIQDLIARYAEEQLAEAQQLAACNGLHDANARLCRWLLQCADRCGSDRLPLTQELLAQMLGVRRTTITLLAQILQNKGIIRYGRGHIAIMDRGQLEACTCECYRVTHDPEHAPEASRDSVKL